jgi:hypothetical protein
MAEGLQLSRSLMMCASDHTAYIRPAEMMKSYAGAIEAWEVGAEVGNVKNNRPELMERAGLLLLQKARPSPAMTQCRHRHVGQSAVGSPKPIAPTLPQGQSAIGQAPHEGAVRGRLNPMKTRALRVGARTGGQPRRDGK